MRTRPLLALLVLVVIGAVGIALYRGFGPIPGPTGCTTKVTTAAGTTVATLEPDQAHNATLIAAIGVRRGLPARAVSIALATAMQESKLHNLNYGDRDSVGLFQQRPSQGWGTRRQVSDPYYATNAFYDVLAKVEGFESMRITEAAQKVQRSAYPQAYEAHAEEARAMASAMTGYSPAAFTCTLSAPTRSGSADATATALRRAYGNLSITTGPGAIVQVAVPKGPEGRRLGWSIASFAVAHADTWRLRSVGFDSRTWTNGSSSGQGWREATTQSRTVVLKIS